MTNKDEKDLLEITDRCLCALTHTDVTFVKKPPDMTLSEKGRWLIEAQEGLSAFIDWTELAIKELKSRETQHDVTEHEEIVEAMKHE